MVDIFKQEGIKVDEPEDSVYNKYIKPGLQYEAGLGLGLTQGLVNALSSVGNLAPEAYELITGKDAPRFPKVDLMQYAPESNAAQIGGMIGDPIGGIAAPGGLIAKGASKLPLIKSLPQSLKAVIGGGLAGGALSENQRALGTALGAGVSALPAVAGGVAKAFKMPDLKQGVREIQQKFTEKKKDIQNVFKEITKEVEKRGISKVDIDDDLIEKAKTFLPKDEATKSLIKKAKEGDYTALRDLQSDLRKQAEEALSSEFMAERNMAKEINETRTRINDSISNHLESKGHQDLAEALERAKSDYANMQSTYFSDPQLARIFGKSKYVPRNPLTTFTTENIYFERFLQEHPEMEKLISQALRSKSNRKKAWYVGGLLGFEGVHELVNKLMR